MNDKKNIVIAALVAIIILDEAVIMPINKRRALKALKRAGDTIDYLGAKLDENNIPLTEFDKIAMTNL